MRVLTLLSLFQVIEEQEPTSDVDVDTQPNGHATTTTPAGPTTNHTTGTTVSNSSSGGKSQQQQQQESTSRQVPENQYKQLGKMNSAASIHQQKVDYQNIVAPKPFRKSVSSASTSVLSSSSSSSTSIPLGGVNQVNFTSTFKNFLLSMQHTSSSAN